MDIGRKPSHPLPIVGSRCGHCLDDQRGSGHTETRINKEFVNCRASQYQWSSPWRTRTQARNPEQGKRGVDAHSRRLAVLVTAPGLDEVAGHGVDGEAHRLDVSWQANERSRHARLCLPHGIKAYEQTPATREQLVRQCHEASVRPCVRHGCTDTVRRLDLSARGRQRHGDERCGSRAADARDTVEKESAIIGPVPQRGDETLDVPHRRKDLPRLWLADVVDPQTQMAGAPDLGRG